MQLQSCRGVGGGGGVGIRYQLNLKIAKHSIAQIRYKFKDVAMHMYLEH